MSSVLQRTGTSRMPNQPSKSDVLKALGHLVRGLSCIFWGLPVTLVVFVQTARTDWLEFFGLVALIVPIIPPVMLFFGLQEVERFQPQERIWRNAVERTKVLCLVTIGLAPFLFWWHKMPFHPFYRTSVMLLTLCSLFFLFSLNHLIFRLSAMLPDETLRLESRLFTGFNRSLLLVVPFLLAGYWLLNQFSTIPVVHQMLLVAERLGLWIVLCLLLIPLAMTMALLWKIKEAVFSSVFEAEQ